MLTFCPRCAGRFAAGVTDWISVIAACTEYERKSWRELYYHRCIVHEHDGRRYFVKYGDRERARAEVRTHQYLYNYARSAIYTTFLSFPSLALIRASYRLFESGHTEPVSGWSACCGPLFSF